MPTIRFAIDSRRARQGAQEWRRSLQDMRSESRQAGRDSEALQQRLDRFEETGRKVRQSLRNIFGGIGVAFAVRGVTRVADSFTNLENRLRLVADSEREVIGITEELFDIADDTRSAFGGTGEVFARVAVSAKELGRSNQELLGFTRSLNQAIILSGASAIEANAGLIQLAQGIASGTLRGDELRSVLEQLPAVADVIARHLGITRGELRQLGSEGKITADVIIDAFQAAADELERDFATTTTTVGQSITGLGTATTKFIADLDDATGATSTIAGSIGVLSDNVDVAAGGLALIGTRIAVGFASNRIDRIRQATERAAELRQETLSGARATQVSSQADLRASLIEQQRSRSKLIRLRVLARESTLEVERTALLRQAQIIEAQLAAQTQNLAGARRNLAVSTNSVAAAQANISRSAGLRAARAAASGLSAALGGIPGTIALVGTAAVILKPQLEDLAFSIAGITKEERELKAASEDLFDSFVQIGDLRGTIREATGDEQRLRLVARGLTQIRAQLDEIARLEGRGVELVPIRDFANLDPNVGRRVAREALSGILDEVEDGATAIEVQRALQALFEIKPADPGRTIVSGRNVIDIPGPGFTQKLNELLEEAGGNLRGIPPDKILDLVRLEQVSIEVLERILSEAEDKGESIQDRLQKAVEGTESRAREPRESGLLEYLNDLEDAASRVGRSAESLAVAEARAAAAAKAIGDLSSEQGEGSRADLRALIADLQDDAEDAVRSRFSRQAERAIRSEVEALQDEIEVLEASDDVRARVIARQIVENAARAQGIEDVRAFVDARSDEVDRLEALIDAQGRLEDAKDRGRDRDRSQERLLDDIFGPRELIDQRRADLQRLLEEARITEEEFQRISLDLNIEEARLGTTPLDGLREGFLEVQRTTGDTSDLIARSLTQAFQTAEDSFVEFVRTGEFSLESLGELAQETLARLAFRQGLDLIIGVDDSLLSNSTLAAQILAEGGAAAGAGMITGATTAAGILAGQSTGDAIAGTIPFFFFNGAGAAAGAGAGADPISGTVPFFFSERGNVFDRRGIVESARGNVFETRSGAVTVASVMRHQAGGAPGVPGLQGLPGLEGIADLGREEELFVMPDGRLGSLREKNALEAIVPLEHPGLPDGIKVVGTDRTLPVARDGSGRLGVSLPRDLFPKQFQLGGVPGGEVPRLEPAASGVIASSVPVSSSSSRSFGEGVSSEVATLRGNLRDLNDEVRRSTRTASGRAPGLTSRQRNEPGFDGLRRSTRG